MANVTMYRPATLDAFLDDLKTDFSRDEIKLVVRKGVAKATIKRANGHVHTAATMLGGRFQSRTSFDPTGMTPVRRRKLVRQFSKDGLRQTAIADLLGVSQATISLDLRK